MTQILTARMTINSDLYMSSLLLYSMYGMCKTKQNKQLKWTET